MNPAADQKILIRRVAGKWKLILFIFKVRPVSTEKIDQAIPDHFEEQTMDAAGRGTLQ
jgi:hypothetical protein